MSNDPLNRIPPWARTSVLVICVFLSAFFWLRLTYPRFSHINLSISRDQAFKIASDFVSAKNQISISSFKSATIFVVDNTGDRYLQKAIGFEAGEAFRAKHDYDLFFWSVRFFKEGQKEEFRVAISSSSGEVLSYNRLLEDSAPRSNMSASEAENMGRDFMIRQFGWDPKNWDFNATTDLKFDHRIEYTFTWEKRGIYIPWDPDSANGGGKLLCTVVVSGGEILAFSKQYFSIPDQFARYAERIKESGRNLSLISNIGSIFFIVGAIWFIVLRRNHLTMHSTKSFYIRVIAVLFLISIISALNSSQAYLYSYPTTQPFISFFARQTIYEVLERFFYFVCFIIPCLAGELLRFEVFPRKPKISMFHYVTSTFLSKDVARNIVIGYCFAVVMIGFQSLIFEFGYNFCDVWMERGRLSSFSSTYFPFLGVLVLAVNASISEETFYRLFGVNFSIKVFRNAALGILIPSLIWGFGHTGYIVFPFWFRGLEVSLLGIFISLVYLRYGLISVIVLHYVFDAFWASAPYVFGRSPNMDFWMSLCVMTLPFIWGMVAFIANRPENSRKVVWKLNTQQRFNLNILKAYIQEQASKDAFNPDDLRAQLIRVGWDIAVVDVAFQELNLTLSAEHTLSDP